MIEKNNFYLREAKKIEDLLQTHQNILIISHPYPDGDSIGASLALYMVFKKLGHEVNIIIPNVHPPFLGWLPAVQNIIIYEQHIQAARKLIQETRLVFCVDFNNLKRLNQLSSLFNEDNHKYVLIDHHPQPDNYFDVKFHTIHVSSTSELVYELLLMMGLEDSIDLDVTLNLYVGIMTDTGSFSYSCNYPRTYEITARLIEKGIDAQKTHNLIYDTFSELRMRLLGYLLLNRMIVMQEYKTAYMWLSLEDQKTFQFQPGDAEGFVNYALAIEGIRLAAFFTEKPDMVRVSFRSKGSFSVNELARKYFDGGGHLNAAGANSYKTLQETLRYFEAVVKENIIALCQKD